MEDRDSKIIDRETKSNEKKERKKKGRHRYFLRNKEQGLASVKKKNHPATITIDATVSLASPHSDPV